MAEAGRRKSWPELGAELRRFASGLSGRELTVIILTVIVVAIVVAVSLTLAFVSVSMQNECHVRYEMPNYGPAPAAFLVPLACVVPLGLALAWRLRRVFWVWTLVALVLTPVIALLIMGSAEGCPPD